MHGTAVALVGALMLLCAPARADPVMRRARQLRSAREYKVRLSAALWLSSQRDPRALRAITRALRHDRAHTVRSIAAITLGKMVDESLPPDDRDRAIDALAYAAEHDANATVRAKSRTAWERIRALRSPHGPRGRLPRVFVAVGAPTTRAARLAPKRTRAAMQRAMRRALREHAPDFGQSTRRDGLPTHKQLRAARSAGFYVNASVASIDVRHRGGAAEVRCEVTMRVNPWTGRDGHERLRNGEAAAATGRGRVRGTDTVRAIAQARHDCVVTVVEQLTARQIVPFVRRSVDRRVAQAGSRP